MSGQWHPFAASANEAVGVEAVDEAVRLVGPRLVQAAGALYDPTLAYHHFGHALRAFAAGERLIAGCASAGIPVDAGVVRLALLFHDAGFGTDPATAGCPSPEAFSAALAHRELTGAVSGSVRAGVGSAILATERTAVPATVEGFVVRAADLAELAADFGTYAANSEALRDELQRTTGVRVADAEWGSCCVEVVTGYLDEAMWPMSLPGAVQDPRGFKSAARDNLTRYLAGLHVRTATAAG